MSTHDAMDWDKITVDAAISAMQGIIEAKGGIVFEIDANAAADLSVRLADALVRKLQKDYGKKHQVSGY